MTDTRNSEGQDQDTPQRKPLSLKRKVDSGTVRQNFPHGRTKTVVVEKKRRKTVPPKGAEADAAKSGQDEADTAAKTTVEVATKRRAAAKKPAAASAPVDDANLTDQERERRNRALEEAKKYDAEQEKRRAEEEVRLAKEREETEARRAQEALEAKDAKAKAPDADDAPADGDKADRKSAKKTRDEAEGRHRKSEDDDDSGKSRGSAKDKEKEDERARPVHARKGERKRREGKLTINNVTMFEEEERVRSLASVKRAREREKRAAASRIGEQNKIVREVVLPETITVEELSNRMAERVAVVVRKLMENGQMLTKNDVIDADTAELIVEEFGHAVKRVSEADVEEGLFGHVDEDEHLTSRAPVVTVMGHVDHGKTSLLDALRKTDVVAGEAGGITQHIGAYQVTLPSGQQITFLDTPGHAAFTSMRARGAKVTDIVVLVVSADDGVMPQTVEAIAHAKAAEVPIIVAINKIDKPDANPDRVRQELLQHEIVVEQMGGDVLDVEVSALKGTNLDKLEEAILLQSEILDLKANADTAASGVVVEAKLDKGRGPVATTLVQRGTLKVGDIVVAGERWGKIRALINDKSQQIQDAGPTVPVEILGLDGAPEPGDQFVAVDSEQRAREITEYRIAKAKEAKNVKSRGSLEQMMSQLKESDKRELPIVIKADVQGSAEALIAAFENMSTDEVGAKVIHSGVGGITESDVILAAASNALIFGFNVRANKQAREHAARDGIEVRYYSIIYDVIDDVKAALSGMLTPDVRETFIGNAEILEVFNITKVGRVAGCRVVEGKVKRGAKVRLIRDDVVIHEGTLSTLKRFKDEVREVDMGQECGMAFENYQDIQQGDIIECFDVEEVARTLD